MFVKTHCLCCQCSYPVWEDFSAKATKLHSQLRTTVLATVAFLDAFQKVADMATNTRGRMTAIVCLFVKEGTKGHR
ncbi:Protein MTSS 2 [Ameca splendens]|uniref:Protein MTSS 2 n=1 Tax=Ameca splendens TaxID=208324 RepID=A0ABV0Z4J8_9TELE